MLIAVLGALASARSEAAPIPVEMAALEEGVPIALRAERLADGVVDAARLVRLLGDETLASGLRALLGPHGIEASLKRLGLDPHGPLLVHADRELRTLTFTLPVRDADRFRSWLEEQLGERAVELGQPERAVWMVAASGGIPILCGLVAQHAACQLGAHPRGVRSLQSFLLRVSEGLATRAWTGRRVSAAWRSLSADHRWRGLARPRPGVRSLSALLGRLPLLDHPRVGPSHRAFVRWVLARARAAARWADLVTMSLDVEDGMARARLLALLGPAERRGVARRIPAAPSDARIRRWAATPAPFRLYVRLQPSGIERLLDALGTASPGRLSGELGVLAYGVRDRCPSEQANLRWSELVHHAVAVGRRVDRHHLAARPPTAAAGAAIPAGRPVVLDDLMLAATGPLGTRAALRRLRSADRRPSGPTPDAFFEAALDFEALSATLASHRSDHLHPPLVRSLERLERMALHLRRVQVWARLVEPGIEGRVEVTW